MARRRPAHRPRHHGQLDLPAERRGADAQRLGPRGAARRAERRQGLHARLRAARDVRRRSRRRRSRRRISRSASRREGFVADTDLAGVPGLGGPGSETDFEPSAGWTDQDGMFVLLTWGSSTCPPVVDCRRGDIRCADHRDLRHPACRPGLHDGHGSAGHRHRRRRLRGRRERRSGACERRRRAPDSPHLRRELTPSESRRFRQGYDNIVLFGVAGGRHPLVKAGSSWPDPLDPFSPVSAPWPS